MVKRKYPSVKRMREVVVQYMTFAREDSGDHAAEIAGDLANALVYGNKPMTMKELQQEYDDAMEAREELGLEFD